MKQLLLICLLHFSAMAAAQPQKMPAEDPDPPAEMVMLDFKNLLDRPPVDMKPSFQQFATDSVLIEKGYFYSEATEKVPVLIYKPVSASIKSFPVVICLHGTGGSKDDGSIKEIMYRLTKAGIMAVAIDARYHGERVKGGAGSSTQYVAAITKAWENKGGTRLEHPFFYDTVYDLWRLTDYLFTRKDVQNKRIGMMGISMGGIETWMAASVDVRIKVAVPVIAAQSFKWSLENNLWQGRAKTIWKAHEQAAKDLGDSSVNAKNVSLLWAKLVPEITGEFDCPSMIRLFAPRPLLLLCNEKDANCPLGGAKLAFEAATTAYKTQNAVDRLMIHVTPNEPHRFLPEYLPMTIDWFKKWL